MDDNIKVLMFASDMDVGGIENQLMHLLRQADKKQFHIDFVTAMDAPLYKQEIEALGSACIKVPRTQRI